MTDNLDPITPDKAIDMYLWERQSEVAPSTIQSHEYRLDHLARWCDLEGIDNLNDLSGRDLHEYKLWREDDGDLSKASLKTQMDTIRVFIRFCESIDAVSTGLYEKSSRQSSILATTSVKLCWMTTMQRNSLIISVGSSTPLSITSLSPYCSILDSGLAEHRRST